MFSKYAVPFWLALALLIVLAHSCTCNYHLKKAAKKCPSLVVQDTILVHDSILVDKITTDTIFRSQIGDTIYINKDRLHIKYVRLPGDTTYIKGQCDSIYVNRFIKVPYVKTVYKFDGWSFIRKNILWLLIILVLIWTTIQYFRLTR